MILTVTPTPALDRTAQCAAAVVDKGVHQLEDVFVVPAGGGMNVAHALYLAGVETLAVVPAPEISQYMRMVSMFGIPADIVEVPGPIPVHFKVQTPTGTTEFLDPPMPLDVAQLAILREHIVANAETASWAVLAGQLPEVANTAWFVDVMRALHLYHPLTKVAISTSGPALSAVLRQVYTTKPDLLVVGEGDLGDAVYPSEVVETLLDADVSHVLVCHDQTHFTLHSRDMKFHGEFSGDAARQRLPWVDLALAGALLGDPDADPHKALQFALAYANWSRASDQDLVPTPDQVPLDQVRIS